MKDGNILTDSICEGMLKTVIKYAPIAIKEPDNYEARAALMQVASFGCNDVPAIGRTPRSGSATASSMRSRPGMTSPTASGWPSSLLP